MGVGEFRLGVDIGQLDGVAVDVLKRFGHFSGAGEKDDLFAAVDVPFNVDFVVALDDADVVELVWVVLKFHFEYDGRYLKVQLLRQQQPALKPFYGCNIEIL